jgi:predicted helicase
LSRGQKKRILPPALARIHYFTLTDEQTRKEKLEWFATTAFGDIPFERITPDDRHTWLNQTDNDFDTLLPLCSKDVKSGKAKMGAVFELFSPGINTARDEWVIDYTPDALAKKMKFFADFYNTYKHTNGEYDTTIKWSEQLKRNHSNSVKEPFDEGCIVPVAYRPYSPFFLYFSSAFIDRQGQADELFIEKNFQICFSGLSASKTFQALAVGLSAGFDFLEKTQCLPLYRYENGERRENITEWGVQQFRARYGKSIEREDIFHYVYAVLHCPQYRRKYEQNLKRDFPRVPFYADFAEWTAWGQDLMRLHVDYENVEPFPLEREDKPVRAGTPLPLKSKLKADKAAGIIAVDESTTLGGIPAEAWEYKLGNRSALEWVCDQYRDYTPSDPTIREKFHTYRFADHKEQVITLLQRVCRVSLETVRITRAMEA